MMQSIDAVIQTVPEFAGFDGSLRRRVADISVLTEAAKGTTLFREGMLPEALYVLVDGQVLLTGTAADASRAVIDVMRPASSFVLANVLADDPYLMGAHVVAPSLLLRVAAEPMRAMVAGQPAVAMAMMRAMAADLAGMTRQVTDLKARGAAGRLGGYLLSLVTDPQSTRAEFRLPVRKGLLGPWLGCRAENLSRAFSALRAFGVETHGSRVVLHDVARLRSYAGSSQDRGEGDARLEGDASERSSIERSFGDAFRLNPARRHRS